LTFLLILSDIFFFYFAFWFSLALTSFLSSSLYKDFFPFPFLSNFKKKKTPLENVSLEKEEKKERR